MKKLFSLIMAIAMAATIFCVPANAVESKIDEDILQAEGTILLNKLLDRQFEANKSGTLIDTSDIFAETSGTALYKQYLYWYSGLTAATEEYWTDYDYQLDFSSFDGDTISFVANLSYGRTCSLYSSEAYGYKYHIQLLEKDGQFYISSIDSNEMNFEGFKNLICGGRDGSISLASENISTASVEKLDSLIADYVKLKESMNIATVNDADVVDMDAEHEAYLEAVASGAEAELLSTSYSYNGERGRRYADTYYANPNTCFYVVPDYPGDCTNWVSQCVWAAYGGWTDGDSAKTMTANINSRKRMQDSSTLNNWFGHQNGIGNPWGGVGTFWNFVTSPHSTGPVATGRNNERPFSGNFRPTDFLTGQVLQLKSGSAGTYAHSVYVSGGTNGAYSNIKITQHTPNNRIMLDELIRHWGGTSCYLRQLKFSNANFDR